MTLVVVGSGLLKLSAPAPAGRLYTGAHTRAAIRWARSVSDDVLILSAKYGLVPVGQVIAPYSSSFDAVTYRRNAATMARPISFRDLAAQIAAYGVAGPVATLAGQTYFERLTLASRGAVQPVNPFHRLLDAAGLDHRTGYLARLYNSHYGRWPSPDPIGAS